MLKDLSLLPVYLVTCSYPGELLGILHFGSCFNTEVFIWLLSWFLLWPWGTFQTGPACPVMDPSFALQACPDFPAPQGGPVFSLPQPWTEPLSKEPTSLHWRMGLGTSLVSADPGSCWLASVLFGVFVFGNSCFLEVNRLHSFEACCGDVGLQRGPAVVSAWRPGLAELTPSIVAVHSQCLEPSKFSGPLCLFSSTQKPELKPKRSFRWPLWDKLLFICPRSPILS